jgi:hypothetical protein
VADYEPNQIVAFLKKKWRGKIKTPWVQATAASTILLCSCTSPLQRNTTWYFDIPQGDVRFIFLPKNLGMLASGSPSSETEVEATYKASSITGSDIIWVDQDNSSAFKIGKGDAAQAEIKIKTKLPAFEAKKEMVVDVYEPVPDQYKDNLSHLNRDLFSKYMSESVSIKYLDIKKEAVKNGAQLVLIKEHVSYTTIVNTEPWYRIYIHASIGNEKN